MSIASLRYVFLVLPLLWTSPVFAAYTAWNVKWDFGMGRDGKGCRVTRASTTVAVEYTMPRWKPPANADRATRQSWERFIKALKAHEDGHRDIGIGAARAIENVVGNMTRVPCDDLSRKASEAAKKILNDARKKEVEYERRTQHGVQQGARFP
jgi:predicted secreted Zn-dependent protease